MRFYVLRLRSQSSEAAIGNSCGGSEDYSHTGSSTSAPGGLGFNKVLFSLLTELWGDHFEHEVLRLRKFENPQ